MIFRFILKFINDNPARRRLIIFAGVLSFVLLVVLVVFLWRRFPTNQERQNFEESSENVSPDNISKNRLNPIETLMTATKEKNSALCQNFKGSDADYCIGNVAMAVNDSEICKEIKDQAFYTKCLELFSLKIITEAGEVKRCSELTDAELRRGCHLSFFKLFKNVMDCLDLNGAVRQECQDFFLARDAYEKDDEGLCQKIVSQPRKKDCLDNLGARPKDSDKDGLTDEEEAYYGTDPENADMDNDGLNDYLEIKKYLTNPRYNDTDRDGFLDGEEVKQGFNPRGE